MVPRRDAIKGGIATLGALAFGRVLPASARHARGGGNGLAPGFFPADHWINSPVASFNPSDQTATQIYPRPDSETATWARHHWIYYDGTTAFKNIIPIALRGGAFPYVYEIVEAPSNAGASMGASIWQANWIIADALAAGYGDLWIQPTGAFTNATFTVRVWDQTGSYNDVTFTASTVAGYYFNATTPADSYGFIFLDPVNGTDPSSYPSTTGLVSTIGSPIKTTNWAWGSTTTSQTYPNAILVGRAGTISTYVQNAQYGIYLSSGYGPTAFIGYPGESVSVDMTNSPTVSGAQSSAFYANTSDIVLQNLTLINGPSGSTNFSAFMQLFQHHRILLHNIAQPNAWSGTAPTSNASLWTAEETNTKNYLWMKGCSDSNRTDSADGSGTEAMALYVWGDVQYGGAELCTSTGCVSYGPSWKWSDGDVTLRCSEIVMGTTYKYSAMAADVAGDVPGSPVMQNREVCYCILGGPTNSAFIWNQNQQQNGSLIGPSVSYRNSIYGFIKVWPTGNVGPYESISDAIQYGAGNQAMMIGNSTGVLPSNMILTNPDAQAATGVLNAPSSGDYTLASAYSAWNGLRGAFIS